MKKRIVLNIIVFVFCIASSILLAVPGYTSLYNLNSASDGANPIESPIHVSGVLYGTNVNGGTNGSGTIYKVNIDGSNYTVLRQMSSSDGDQTTSKLYLINNTLYGVANSGGTNNQGTVYSINTDGTNFTVLHDFVNATDGEEPRDGVMYDGTYLYGVCLFGGANSNGTIWKILPNGTGFANIFDFDDAVSGKYPVSRPYFSSGKLYGAVGDGGVNNFGTLYSINTDGTGFTSLYDFSGADGSNPYGALIEIDSYLWGVTSAGGSSGAGIIFKIAKDGTGFTNIHDFNTFVVDCQTPYYCELVNNGDYVYGATHDGGTNSSGAIFSLQKDGTNFSVLYNLNSPDGVNAASAPILVGNILYGTTYNGGTNSDGTLYSYELAYNLATVTCNAASNITYSSTALSGEVTATGSLTVSDRGFVVGTSSNPTITSYSSLVSVGTGLGTFNTTLSGLNSNTTYYVRAYATNNFGTAYSSEITFTTSINTALDSDGDGVSNDNEALGPNSGDGNGDGIADNLQNYVTTLYTVKGNYVTIYSTGSTAITNTQSLSANESTYYYPYGLFDFKVTASTATVTLYFHSTSSMSSYEYRKYDATNYYARFQNATFGTALVGGQTIATVTLVLTDGGIGDFDGLINGIIQDPGGPAVVVSVGNISALSDFARYSLILFFVGLGLFKANKAKMIST